MAKSVGMLVRNRVVTLDRIEAEGWQSVPDFSKPSETNLITAYLSDGRVICDLLAVTYERGQRERILEAMLQGSQDIKIVHELQAIRALRWKLERDARARFQREYGNGFVTPL